MNKMLKGNKGFSLIELLIALLIMAVIAAVAISLFGGVLSSSKASADRSTAEGIKQDILTYMNTTNDVNFSFLGAAADKDTADELIAALQSTYSVTTAGAFTVKDRNGSVVALAARSKDSSDLSGNFGPFIDPDKETVRPQDSNNPNWSITINQSTQKVSVVATSSGAIAGTVTYIP